MTRVRRIFAFLLILVAGATLLAAAEPENPSENKVIQLTLNDVIIGPVVEEYIQQGIEQAEAEKAMALLIHLDTPGGLLNSTRKIVKAILGANVPVIVYVAPDGARAGSAGVFITLAANIAAMAPSTNIGAAHPVTVGDQPGRQDKDEEGLRELLRQLLREREGQKPGEEKTESQQNKSGTDKEPMEEKILNDTVAWVTSIAEKRGRNAEWAVKAVTESASITADEALSEGVIDLIAKDVDDLLAQINGRVVTLPNGDKTLQTASVTLIDRPMSGRQNLLSVLINPNIAYILMMIGFYGLLFEVTHPGAWFPGIAGVISLILAFYAFNTIPTNFAGLALIIVALALFIAEAFVPSFGLLTVGGVVSMLLGSIFLIDSPFELMQVSYAVIFPVVAATAFIAVFLVTLAVRSQRTRTSTGLESMVGQIAVAKTDIQPQGKVFIVGELWNATSDEPITAGDEVEIISGEGMLLKVKKAKKET